MAEQKPRQVIGLVEQYRAEAAIEAARTLGDLRIYAITQWKLYGNCSRHGYMNEVVDTTEDEPTVTNFVCHPCATEDIDRTVRVTYKERI